MQEGFYGFTELEQAFFEDGYRLAKEEIGKKLNISLLLPTIKKLYEMLDTFLKDFLKEAEGSDHPSHCKKTCAFCCHQAVYAQSHEIKYLKHWMFEHLDATELETIRKNAYLKRKNTRDLAHEELLLYKEPCPLLINSICNAYEARPVACRIYFSYSVNSCITEFTNPGHKTSFPQLFKLPLSAGQKLNEGFVFRLKELGMVIKELQLEVGL